MPSTLTHYFPYVTYIMLRLVTAAFGAAAHARIPLTDRRLASKIVFLSNHCCAGKTVPDWKDAVSKDATILVYMPGADCEGLTAKLRAPVWRRRLPVCWFPTLLRHNSRFTQRPSPIWQKLPAFP